MNFLFWLGFSCIEKRVMPEKLKEALIFDVDLKGDISTEKGTEHFIQDMKLSVDVKEVNRDDSLLLEIVFLEVKWKPEEEASWTSSPLEGNSFFITAFPWGEMLKIEGWETLPEDPHLDTLDIIVPLLFPNPPVRESQQWHYRVLPWRYRGELPEDYLRLNQKIIASWAKDSEDTWSYQGEWIAKTRLDDILQGEVKGELKKTGVWIDSHEWDWEREILFPESQKQHFQGKIQRAEF